MTKVEVIVKLFRDDGEGSTATCKFDLENRSLKCDAPLYPAELDYVNAVVKATMEFTRKNQGRR